MACKLYRRVRTTHAVCVNVELDKDDGVFKNGANGSKQPGNGIEQVLLVLRVGDQADAIRGISSQGQEEE